MPVTVADFERIVAGAERAADRNPVLYRLQVAAWGMVGYAFVWLLLVGTIGIAVGIVYLAFLTHISYAVLKVLIPVVVLIGILLKAIWVRFAPPTGIVLRLEDFPGLKGSLDRIRKGLRGPRIHSVLIDGQFNAGITQQPQLGLFGWHRNYLVLGMPLMLALSETELEAVLAHEYGHLSGADGKSGAWIYRIRMTWMRLLTELHRKENAAIHIVRGFFERYAPWFNAYSFVLARSNEYAADRAASEHAGKRKVASALLRIELAGQALHEIYWPAVMKRADDAPEPPDGAISGIVGWDFTWPGKPPQERLTMLLGRRTDLVDSHPSLADRLAAVGVEPWVPEARVRSAAETLFGTALPDLLETLDERWKRDAGPWFESRHEFVTQARKRLVELVSDTANPEIERLKERARILVEVDGREAATPVFEEILDKDPGNGVARLYLAVWRLSDGDVSAAEDIEALASEAPDLAPASYHALMEHCMSEGDRASTGRYEGLLRSALQERDDMLLERQSIPFASEYEPATLSASTVALIRGVLEGEDLWIDRAYLVRRRLTKSTAPVHVLGLAPSSKTDTEENLGFVRDGIADQLRDLEDEIYVVLLAGPNKRLERYLADVDASRIF